MKSLILHTAWKEDPFVRWLLMLKLFIIIYKWINFYSWRYSLKRNWGTCCASSGWPSNFSIMTEAIQLNFLLYKMSSHKPIRYIMQVSCTFLVIECGFVMKSLHWLVWENYLLHLRWHWLFCWLWMLAAFR